MKEAGLEGGTLKEPQYFKEKWSFPRGKSVLDKVVKVGKFIQRKLSYNIKSTLGKNGATWRGKKGMSHYWFFNWRVS